ncbi:histidine phosphatase family protein [Rothia kristinae]|uniref:histidine phosphatase family protein n=1 Tax=Rothia kristinae TaxID=37923 RepID=UPI0011A51694|nr:histidine phosphatase family protein [Rothia kristinae]
MTAAPRTRSLVRELAQRHPGADVVLVAHGDVLQITQAWTAGRPPAEHRSLPHLGNAELRRLLPRQS